METSREPGGKPRDQSKPMSVPGEVLAVLRLAFTLRLEAHRLVGRDLTIALFGAAALAIWALLDWTRYDEPVRLDSRGLPGVAACGAVAVGIAWLLSRTARPTLPFRQTLWLVTGYLPAAVAGVWLLRAPITRDTAIAVACLFAAHAVFYFFFGLRALSSRPPWRAFGAWTAAVAGIVWLASAVPLNAGIWLLRQAPEELADYLESEKRTEELMYAQAERIDGALAAMDADNSPGPAVYFLGFAGYGDQKVFAREITLAADRVHERYGSANRSLLLVNDRRDYDRHPLASPSALARAVAGIAAQMDREHDVLFLALSSHGRDDPYLVVTNGALPLDHLTGSALARILNESKIRWKVLVISACYAGAFIDHLRDEHTIVITAAAPDKMSFGCNDRRELTYFGEAFYRDALPAAESLRAAFHAAEASVTARERAAGLEPSQPRAHFGEAIERKLAELEKRVVPGRDNRDRQDKG